MATKPTLDQLADQIVEATRTFLLRQLAPRDEVVRSLTIRLDRHAQLLDEMKERLVVLEGRSQEQRDANRR